MGPTTPRSRATLQSVIAWERSQLTIRPLDRQTHLPSHISGWKAFIHPCGAPYFVLEDRHIFTDADVRDASTRRLLLEFYGHLQSRATANQVTFPTDAHLMLQLRFRGSQEVTCKYYFADVQTRSLFWVEDFSVNHLLWDIKGPVGRDHFRKFA
jgi:hypothetical protein